MSRKPTGDKALTPAERAKRYRQKRKQKHKQKPPLTQTDRIRQRIIREAQKCIEWYGPDRTFEALNREFTDRLWLNLWRLTTEGQAHLQEQRERERERQRRDYDQHEAGRLVADLGRTITGQ